MIAIIQALLILIVLAVTDIIILLDIPIFRQIIGFIFLTFLPGALFLCILKPDKLKSTEMFVLSVGLSISFIMLVGVLFNSIYSFFGYNTPLSLRSLLIPFNFILLILSLITHIRGGITLFADRTDLRLDVRDKAAIIIPTIFPTLSVFGMHMMETANNNVMIMALFFLVPGYAILISAFHSRISEKAYPIIILLSSISIVLLLGMRSSHIIGTDSHLEYYFFQQTLSIERWQIFVHSTLDSCLSISILPTVYQSYLNTNPEYLFKILYPFLFSISPLVVYLISKEYLPDVYAFLASVFFMSQSTFISTTSQSRTTVAILFFALSIMVLLNSRLSEFNKRLLFIIFIFSCIVSHYSTTYIFFSILLFTIILVQISYRIFAYQIRSSDKKVFQIYEQNIKDSIPQLARLTPSLSYITPTILLIFFLAIFIWYSEITGVAFDIGVKFITDTIRSMQDFFILESRQKTVTMAFGYGVLDSEIPRKTRFVFSWLSIIFIAIGVLSTLYLHRQRLALPFRNSDQNPGLLKKKIDILLFLLAIICSSLMVAAVAFPKIASGYGIDRVYLLTMVVLSFFFVIGGMTVAQLIGIRRKYLVVLIVLIPFFMCTTGIIHQLFNSPASITLNSDGNAFDIFYIYDRETFASRWLSSSFNANAKIYSDNFGDRRLMSQGLLNVPIYTDSIVERIHEKKTINNGYVYLRYCNVVKNKLYTKKGNWCNTSDYQEKFKVRNLIYANGGSQILAPSFIEPIPKYKSS